MRRPWFHVIFVCVCALLAFASRASAADWPEWRGDGRRGEWTEDGVLKKFPESGLRYTWRVPIAEGYAGPAVAGGRVFVTDFVRGARLRGTERALCLDERTGKLKWSHEWAVDYSGTEPRWATGPRATPTVAQGRVHVLGGMGQLLTLDAASGKLLWQRDFPTEYDAPVPTWGVSSSPLVHRGKVIALVGGPKAKVVAFDAKSGEEVWKALTSKGQAGYASPILIRAGGVTQLIVWDPEGLSALDPASGKLFWHEPFDSKMGMSVATPVFDGGKLLVSAFFDGAMLLELDEQSPAAKQLWRRAGRSEQPADTDGLHALITTPVLAGDQIYGIGSYGELRGLRASDGERLWQSLDLVGEQARWAAGLIVLHEDRYFINTDSGDLVIARFTPKGYVEIDRTPLIEPTTAGGGRRKAGAVNWTHPAYANRHIIVRNDREIVRASLQASHD